MGAEAEKRIPKTRMLGVLGYGNERGGRSRRVNTGTELTATSTDVFEEPLLRGSRPVESVEVIPLVKRIGLFGSTRGDTATSGWRNDEFEPMLRKRGVVGDEHQIFFNPVVDDWTEEDGRREVLEFMQDRFLAFYILDTSNGITSLIELGAAEWGALTRGQDVFIRVKEVDENELNDDSRRARNLTLARVEAMKKSLGDRVHIYNSLGEMADDVAVNFINADRTPIRKPELPEPRADLLQTILVSGTSGAEEPAYQIALKGALGNDMTGLWVKEWDNRPEAQQRESELKARAAVKVHVITNDTPSFGALSEAYAMAVESFYNGQRMVLVLEDGWKNTAFNTTPPVRESFAEGAEGDGEFARAMADYNENLKTARNSRAALVEHFKRHEKENPHGIKFIRTENAARDAATIAASAAQALEHLRSAHKKSVAREDAERLLIAGKKFDRVLWRETRGVIAGTVLALFLAHTFMKQHEAEHGNSASVAGSRAIHSVDSTAAAPASSYMSGRRVSESVSNTISSTAAEGDGAIRLIQQVINTAKADQTLRALYPRLFSHVEDPNERAENIARDDGLYVPPEGSALIFPGDRMVFENGTFKLNRASGGAITLSNTEQYRGPLRPDRRSSERTN